MPPPLADGWSGTAYFVIVPMFNADYTSPYFWRGAAEYIAILLVAITWHELAHAFTAEYLGDDTPRRMGHISLNPFRHMDQFGIILMFMSVLAGFGLAYGFTPVNERNLHPNSKVGGGIVAVAGPLSNIVLAALLAIPFRFNRLMLDQSSFAQNPSLDRFVQDALILNLFLAAFNIIPIPPLDGWRVLQTFLTPRQLYDLRGIVQYGPFVLILLILLGGRIPGFDFLGWIYGSIVFPAARTLVGAT